jgi:hypothetical protein
MLERALQKGLVEVVVADLDGARSLIEDAKRHLVTAKAAAAADPNGAYQLGYDAARKAIAAHMLARGFRVAKSRGGGHETVGRYGVAEVVDDKHFRAFDRMRRRRNQSEYGPARVGSQQLEEDLEHAEAIVDAVQLALRPDVDETGSAGAAAG